VPDQSGGLLGVELKSGKKLWLVAGAIARWATPSVWSHAGKQYVLCANDKGDLRLIDPASGKELWKLGGLGPNWFTLAPGKTHVLVNVAADSGKTRGAERKSGRLGAIKLSTAQGERAWTVAESYRIPVWMDSGARMRVLYRDGKFLLPNSSEEEADDGDEDAKPSAQASAEKAGKRSAGPALLIDEATGKVLSTLPPQGRRDDNLAGLIYWTGDRVLSRGDSYHGPKHGGRHPWSHWTTAGDKLEPLPNKMDLSEFTNAYEVAMETPLVGGLMFERTEDGGMVCYELCAK
jgi:hypothetical protein